MARSKLVTVESSGALGALGGLNGPITTPSNIEMRAIIALINSGKVVYEVNPNNPNEKVRLNRLNVTKDNFPIKKPQPVKVQRVAPVHNDSSKNKNKYENKHTKNHEDNHKHEESTPTQETGVKLVGSDMFVSNKKS